jgi:hypothetical protein
VFADRPLDEIGWAPVAQCRRVPGGAVLQIRVRGAGAVRIPAAGIPAPFALVVEGPTPGSRGAGVLFRFEKGSIIFEATPQLSGRWIYVIPVAPLAPPVRQPLPDGRGSVAQPARTYRAATVRERLLASSRHS